MPHRPLGRDPLCSARWYLPTPTPFADATTGTMQSPRYASIAALLAAKKVADLL
jgi:hypothetical protein